MFSLVLTLADQTNAKKKSVTSVSNLIMQCNATRISSCHIYDISHKLILQCNATRMSTHHLESDHMISHTVLVTS